MRNETDYKLGGMKMDRRVMKELSKMQNLMGSTPGGTRAV